MEILRQIWQKNKNYFILFSIVFVISTIIVFLIQKGDAIVWANSLHNYVTNKLFKYWTMGGEYQAFLIVIVILLFVKVRYALYVPFVGGLTAILSFATKFLFAHDRPFRYFSELGLFEALKKVEGLHIVQASNSFPSGHTMAGFALFTYLAFCIKPDWAKLLCLIVAIGVGFSRIYLIQHFLEDVILGALLGVLIAVVMYYVQESWRSGNRFSKAIDQPVYSLFKKRESEVKKV